MFIFIIQLYNHFPVSLRFSENWSFIRTQEYMYEDLQRPTLYCLLTEKDVWIRVNGKEPISLKANHMALLNCENNIIDVSSLNNTLVAHISHDIIKDYLRFLNKDLSQIPVWQRSATPILTLPCLTPDVFRVAAQHSMMPAETESEKERTRALLFTVLSRFLDSKKFLSLMMYMLRNCVSDSVYQIIESEYPQRLES